MQKVCITLEILVSTLCIYIQGVASDSCYRSTSYKDRTHTMACNVHVTSDEVNCLKVCDELENNCLHAVNVGDKCYVCMDANMNFKDHRFNNTHSQNTEHFVGKAQDIFEKTDIVNECLSNPCVYGVCLDREEGYYCECPVGFTGVQCEKGKDCSTYRNQGVTQSGIYTIIIKGRNQTAFNVYCDMDTSGGGWTVFQKRFNGSVDFYRNYSTYQKGFGSLDQEFWLGNDFISYITEQGPYELRVDLEAFDGEKRYALYDSFNINADEDYKLWIGNYSGNAGDSLRSHQEHRWSTFDKDNDINSKVSCAKKFHGAWWYEACHKSNLNGLYGSNKFGKGLVWYKFRGSSQSMKSTEMKIRPAGYKPPVY